VARIFKTGARKPRIEDGTAYTGNNTRWAPPEDGFVRAVGMDYTLTVTAKHPEKAEYVAHLSEDEMLRTVSEWLKSMTQHRNSQRANAARDAKEAARK